MSKKVKGPKAGGVENVLKLITDGAALSDVVNAAVKDRVIPRAEIPASPAVVSELMQGFSGSLSGPSEKAITSFIESKAKGLANNSGVA